MRLPQGGARLASSGDMGGREGRREEEGAPGLLRWHGGSGREKGEKGVCLVDIGVRGGKRGRLGCVYLLGGAPGLLR